VSALRNNLGSVAAEDDGGTIYRNSITAEMARRRSQLEPLRGYRLKVDLEALNRCSYTFSRNAQELTNHVGRSATTSASDLSDGYVNELVLLLHNYLTSVTSLIDAQRVVMRHPWPSVKKGEQSEFETTDYASQVRSTFETGEAEFMQKLRNYCTHYSIPGPGLGTRMSWEAGGPVIRVNTLQLDPDELPRWDEWRSAATAYLRAQPEKFDLRRSSSGTWPRPADSFSGSKSKLTNASSEVVTE
jgi:hypothetical protein